MYRQLSRPSDPDAESSFTTEGYESVRGAWLYDQSLDLVAVVNDDGPLAACCIAWFDPSIGVCEIEPLGVVPEHRRRGLAIALCLEVVELSTPGSLGRLSCRYIRTCAASRCGTVTR